ncbi:hypothetical protein [Glycomyces salinus]|uniref:hypothetical protein n=1 Tax=Glycomyces salinus TaxID=980294 RepID=UPI0018EC3776|nr:hypothetical protein [Glycomyces salinus]
MSYSRPDETWGYEPPEVPRPADGSGEQAAWRPPEEAPRRSGRRRAASFLRSRRSTPDSEPDRLPDAEPERSEDHTMPPPTPHWLHRLPPVAVALVIGAGLILGAQLERPIYAAGIGVLQLAMLAAVTWTRRIDGAWVPLAVGALVAVSADWAAVYWTPVSLLPVTVLVAGAFGAAVAAQLVRRDHAGVTENLGFTMLLAIGAAGYACYIALSRLGAAPPAMYSAVVAATTAILAARAVDAVMPDPRINRQVTRGAFGVVIGTMCGTASAAYAGLVIEGPDPRDAAIGGLMVALTAVLIDLACGYLAAARRIDGEGAAPPAVAGVAGPLLAFALTGPVVYLLCAYYLVD